MRIGGAWRTFAILTVVISFSETSESPDRDCCESHIPSLQFNVTSDKAILIYSESPPEIPDDFSLIPKKIEDKSKKEKDKEEEKKEKKGLILSTTSSSNSRLSCNTARQICWENDYCSQILIILPHLCGERNLKTCSSETPRKCSEALLRLRSFSMFSRPCSCQEPQIHNAQDCLSLSENIFEHPCTQSVKITEIDFLSLPNCTQALEFCINNKACFSIYNDFITTCIVKDSTCASKSWPDCKDSWSRLHLTPLFGCICPSNFPNKLQCDEIFNTIHNNSCIDVRSFVHDDKNNKNLYFWNFWYNNKAFKDFKSSTSTSRPSLPEVSSMTTSVEVSINYEPREESKYTYFSTCQLALTSCQNDELCHRYLIIVRQYCDTNTNICDTNQCKDAIVSFYENIDEKMSFDVAFCSCKLKPSPDELCLLAQSILHPVCAQSPTSFEKQPVCHEITRACKKKKKCREKLENFDRTCSVDSSTKTCAGPQDECRQSMIDILGTELRINCTCEGTTDFKQLYECIGWHRLLWVNPCVVEVQHNYHRLEIPETSSSSVSYTSMIWSSEKLRTTTITTTTTRRQSYRPARPTESPSYPTPPWPSRQTTPKTTIGRTTTLTTTSTTLPPKFCLLERAGRPVKYIREGYKKRLYKFDDPECSELCECNEGEELLCKVLDCIKRNPCNTGVAFYSHASPFYQAYRGQCLCYSGSFVCSKPPKEVKLNLPRGVFLFMGFSQKDEYLLKKITGSGATDTTGAIQGLVSYHNVNENKSECRIVLQKHSNENLVFQAVLEEFDENREKNNVTNEVLNREKDECFEALEAISYKINNNDADMRSHVILSMIKVSAAEADVPPLSVSIGSPLMTNKEYWSLLLFWTLIEILIGS